VVQATGAGYQSPLAKFLGVMSGKVPHARRRRGNRSTITAIIQGGCPACDGHGPQNGETHDL